MRRVGIIWLYCIAFGAASDAASCKETDCGMARDPRRCEALAAAREACSGTRGQARSACIDQAMPAPDCSRAPDTAQCQERRAAAQACKDERGRARRKCLRGFKR